MNRNASCLFVETLHTLPLAVVLTVEFGIGLLGNGVALWIFCFRMTMWTPSTIFLFNLSMADFMLLFFLPFRAHYFLNNSQWHFGDVPCRILLFMVSLNRAGSISFLTVVAVDRYFKIVHPYHQVNSITKKEAIGIVALIWSVIIAMTVHILTETHLINEELTNRTLCESFDFNQNFSATQVWQNIFFMAECVVPLMAILFCTQSIVRQLKTRQVERQIKIQTAVRAVTLVSFEFTFCFLPSTVATIAVCISKCLHKCDAFQISCLLFVFSLSLTYLDSVLNPLVFYFSSPTFRSTLNISIVPNFLRKCRNQ